MQFPLHTESENKHRRGMHWAASANKTAKERADVRIVLTQLDRPALHLADRPNAFTVTLTRIFVGELDDDNLRGALKAVRDEVAAWLGLDDRSKVIRWRYGQLTCERGRWAVKIEIEDEEQGVDVERVLGAAPRTLRAPRENRLRAPEEKTRRRAKAKVREAVAASTLEQQRIRFAAAYALLPWEQDDGDPVVTELPIGCDDGDPPESLQVKVPGEEKRRVVLYRHRYRSESLGGDAWLYTVDAPKRGQDVALPCGGAREEKGRTT